MQHITKDGITVTFDEGSTAEVIITDADGFDTLLEKVEYQALLEARDALILGRWRHPDSHPGMVVYPVDTPPGQPRQALVLNESNGLSVTVTEGDTGEGSVYQQVATDYFSTVAPRMPWHDAHMGSIWLVTIESESVEEDDGYLIGTLPYQVVPQNGDAGDLRFASLVDSGAPALPVTDPRITQATPLWQISPS